MLEDVTDKLGSLAIEGPKAGAIFPKQPASLSKAFQKWHSRRCHRLMRFPCYLSATALSVFQAPEIIAPREKLEIIWQNLHTAVHAQHGHPNRNADA